MPCRRSLPASKQWHTAGNPARYTSYFFTLTLPATNGAHLARLTCCSMLAGIRQAMKT